MPTSKTATNVPSRMPWICPQTDSDRMTDEMTSDASKQTFILPADSQSEQTAQAFFRHTEMVFHCCSPFAVLPRKILKNKAK